MSAWARVARTGSVAARTQPLPFLGRSAPPTFTKARSSQALRRASSASSHPPPTGKQSNAKALLKRQAQEQRRLQRPQPAHVPDQLGQLLRVESSGNGGNALNLVFEHYDCSLPLVWFRDICDCSLCVSESSGQKKFATCDIDAVPELESSTVSGDGSLQLVWAHDFLQRQSHTSNYPLPLLQSLVQHGQPLPASVPYAPQRLLWNRATFEQDMDARAISYDEWMVGGQHFAKALLNLHHWGLVLLKGVPDSKDAVKDIANKIGALQNTFYGETWDVVSKPNAENVAYTNEFLCLHQDLMYWYDPPHIQLLHCLKNDCEGGDSLFSDGLRAAAELKVQSPDDYDLLSTENVGYQYARNGNYYRAERRVIATPNLRRPMLPRHIHWSPPFQAPFKVTDSTLLPAWRDAAKKFRDSLEAPENMLQFRLQPGDCVLFENRRVLHGRTQFDSASGHRHLHGAYLDKQTTRSALTRVLEEGHISLSKRQWRSEEWEQAQKMYG